MDEINVCVGSWNAAESRGYRAIYPEGSAVTPKTYRIEQSNLSEDDVRHIAREAYERISAASPGNTKPRPNHVRDAVNANR